MALGRRFPVRNPYREYPYDPMVEGDTQRSAPLPFQIGAGATDTVETTIVVRVQLQTYVSAGGTGTGGGGAGVGTGADCNPLTNQFCVPTGTLTHVNAPTATIRCAIR